MSTPRAAVVGAVAATCMALAGPAQAQLPSYGVGRPPTPEEIRAWDIAVGPDGAELPPGEGTAVSGKPVYDAKCAACHGATGREGPQDVLVGGQGSLATAKPLKTIGSYWPYATTVYDYIYRAMPFTQPESLTAAEVYGVTAYLLYLNGIIGERDLIDRRTLPQVRIPNRHGFVPDPRPERFPR